MSTIPRRRILRLRDVERVTGLRHSTIYELISEGSFPAPVKLAARAVGWVEHEIESWVEARIRDRDAR